MGILRSPDDSHSKELAKWEQRPVVVGGTYIEPIPFADGGRGGMPFAMFPKMLYKAESEFGGPRISATKIVKDESEELIAIGQGWSVTQQEAIDAVAARQLEAATLAANRAHNDRWMSEAAKAEAAAVDESTMEHVAAIPETPIRHRVKREG